MPSESTAPALDTASYADTGKAYPLLRAEWLLTPRAVETPRGGHVWLAAMAFAASGLCLGFIMLMGVGYDRRGHESDGSARIPAQAFETQIVDRLEGTNVTEAIPLRDEDGQPLQQP